MMYASIDYYRNTFFGKEVSSDEKLESLLTRASDDIAVSCLGRIDETVLDDAAIDWLRKATCAQAEFYATEGIAEIAGSVSLGSFSASSDSTSRPGGLSQRAMRFLVFTGLLNRSVASFPHRRLQELDGGVMIPVQTDEVEL